MIFFCIRQAQFLKNCNVKRKRVKKALEWRRKKWQKSICAVRAKRVRYLVSAFGFFDAFSAGNGSAFVFTFALAFYN
ncbi:MAG TPA: hypothetical protein DCZ76_05820 [Treponema sp.]|nr:hypothetical protein [Treponema sp.]